MAIHLETFGGLRVIQDGRELPELPGQKLRCALLLYLSVERKAARERLIEIFWPSPETDRARRTLSQMVYELKQHLGQDWIEARSEQLIGTDQLTTDANEFVEMVKSGNVVDATALYRGPFLRSIFLADTPEFARWVDDQRTRFAALYRDAQGTNVDRLVATHDVSGAIAAARRWVLAEPMDDDAQYRLIDLLARSGLRNQAIRQYEDYTERLAWIDAEPLAAITELVDKLKSGTLKIKVPKDLGVSSGPHLEAETGVVVLPMQNLSEDDTKQWFCDGVSEEIMHSLQPVPGLRVMPRTSAFAPREPEVSVGAVIQELGVTHALNGTVSFVDDRYHVRVALVKGKTDERLWEGHFHGNLTTTDVFELQDDIAQSVLDALADRLDLSAHELASTSATRLRRGETSDPEAQALYHKGRNAWLGRGIPDLAQALELFEESTRRDPSYARAYAGIADVHNVLGGVDYATQPPRELYSKAKAAAERALELGPDLADAHAALGNYLMNHAWDWSGAATRLRHAIALNPAYSPGRQWYSNYLMCRGHPDEAVAEATIALELDPDSAFLYSSRARHYQLMRQPQRAVEEFEHALDMDPRLASAVLGLALAELQCGRPDVCLTKLKDLAGKADREIPLLQALKAYATAIAGDRRGAQALAQRLKTTTAPYLPPELVALVYTGTGEHDRAFKWLDKALEARSPTLTLLGVEPAFDPLRPDPRFQRLLVEVGLKG